MKKIIVSAVLIMGFGFLFFYDNDTRVLHPQPMDTYVNDYHLKHEGKRKGKRQEWMHILHGGDAANWQKREYANSKELKKIKDIRRKNTNLRGEVEEFANGQLAGKWIERGSTSQAGNVRITSYDRKNEMVYCIGGGGPMFKSDLVGSNWSVVNDDFRFSGSFLEIIEMGNEHPRILAAIQGVPHYSDDDGRTWTKSAGIGEVGGSIYHAMIFENIVYILYKDSYWDPYDIYISEDNGESYVSKREFQPSQNGLVSFRRAMNSNDIIFLEKFGGTKFRMYQWNHDTKEVESVNSNIPFEFNDWDFRGLNIVKNGEIHSIYMIDGDNQHWVSHDYGQEWERLSWLPSYPWAVGVFMAPSDPNKMIYGEVDAYRSSDGGTNWDNINRWWEYYPDPFTKLHADIMDVAEYQFDDEENFILIGNHGGISYTNDYGVTNLNIGLLGLNVGQFYDVVTDPNDPYYIYGGTQDQGLQRGVVLQEDLPNEMEQNISGDYGHLKFTNEGKHLWTVYPGGWIGVYEDPRNENSPTASYTINSSNETVWIPPIMESPYGDDVVYAAGGSVNDWSNGSYILRLENLGFTIEATELPFNFAQSGGTISAMAVSPFDSNIWYVLTTNGHYYYSEDGGQSFELRQQFLSNSHYLYGSCILPSKVDPNIVYISGNGYNHAPVYKSENAGFSFSPMDNGMLPTTCFKLAANDDESLIFAATEAGPFVYVQADGEWHSLVGTETPNQTYWSVEFVSATNTARFGTYGRGIWDFSVEESVSSNENVLLSSIKVYPNPTSDYMDVQLDENWKGQNIELQLLDGLGRLVYVEEFKNSESIHRVDLSSFDSGSYHLVLEGSENRVSSKINIVK